MAQLSHDVQAEEASWSDAHRMEVDRRIHTYLIAARAAGQDGDAPQEAWLASYFLETRQKNGVGFARRYAGYIAHHLRRKGALIVTDGLLVQAVLRAQEMVDPLSVDLEIEGSHNVESLPQEYADNAFTAQTYRSYALYGRDWLAWCATRGIDPLRASVQELVTYVELLGERFRSGSVKNRRNAIGHYLRKNEAYDITKDPAVKRVMQGLANVKSPKRIHPLTAQERLRFISAVETRGMGVRDRVLFLILAFTSLPFERISLIDIEHVTVGADGVWIASLNADPPFYIGCHPERDLDLTFWMARLLEILPSNGPLLRPALLREFRFADERATSNCLWIAVRRAANDSGVGGADIADRLRLLFAAETHGKVSDIVRARYANKRSLPQRVTRASESRFSVSRKRRSDPEQERLL